MARPILRLLLAPASILLIGSCSNYPKGRIPSRATTIARSSSLTIVAYGDTRTGPWGLGDNAKQAIHGKVVDDILASDRPVDAVIFTGDAVMTNFFLWRKAYWRCFLSQCNRFRDSGIPFYPSLGNHEVLSPVVPAIKVSSSIQSESTQAQVTNPEEIKKRLESAYESGEEPTSAPPSNEEQTVAGEQIDPSSPQGQALLKQWEVGISKGDTASANKFGQFERGLQRDFYEHIQADDRCDSDAKIFTGNYLDQAKYEYLRPLLKGRSYYTQLIEKNDVRVKLIALDTNCLDSEKQQRFFAEEVSNFSGPIIVFGHHPPVDYSKNEGWSWDKVKGWGQTDNDGLKKYFTSDLGKRVVLWIFGHVHDYQRRGPSGSASQCTAPILLIAGGGGASLDANYAPFQWQPAAWPEPLQKSAYSQVKIVMTNTSVYVEVRGTNEYASNFHQIDSFAFPLSQQNFK